MSSQNDLSGIKFGQKKLRLDEEKKIVGHFNVEKKITKKRLLDILMGYCQK